MKLKFLIFSVVLILAYGCVTHKVSEPYPNAKPETYISLFPDSSLSQSTSNLKIHCWRTMDLVGSR